MTEQFSAGAIAWSATELIEVIETENGLLETRQAHRLIETQVRKEELMRSYADGIAILKSGKVQITGSERRILLDTGKKLESSMAEHALCVARMKSITEGLIHTVAEHVEKREAPAAGYGAHGRSQAASLARNAYRKPTALSVNRMI
jgi:hypothetical protein